MSMRVWLGLLVILGLPSLALGATTGEHAADFLNVGVGARAVGMGKAFIARADDATAAYWNPAGLTHIRAYGFSAMYADVFQKGTGNFLGRGLVHYSFTNFVARLNGRDALGVSWIRMGVDDIPRTTFEDTNHNGILGDFLDINDNGVKDPGEFYLDRPTIAGFFNNTDDAVLISYARRLFDRFSVGGSVKYIRQTLYQNRGTGWGVDFGALLRFRPNVTAGIVLQDALGTRIRWDTAESPTFTRKPSVHAGLAYQPRLPLLGPIALEIDARSREADVSEEGGMGWQFHAGLEYWLFQRVALRVGTAQSRLTAGAGIRLPLGDAQIQADYAFNTHELGDSQRLSITGWF